MEDYLTEDAEEDLANFYKEINANSVVAVTDGNPHSTTAYIASQSYNEFATRVGMTREERENQRELGGSFSMGVVPDAGLIDAGDFEGYTFSLPISMRAKFGDRVGLGITIPFNYVQIEDADIFQVGAIVGLPITIIQESSDNPWHWQLTPSGHGAGAGSVDFASGGLAVGGSASSVVSYNFNSCTLSMGNQISIFEGMEVAGFDSGISQQILKNGLQLSIPIAQRWLFEARGVYSRFLDDAAIDDYFTVGGDFVYRFLGGADAEATRRGYVLLGAYAELADDYTAPHVRVGTGWRY